MSPSGRAWKALVLLAFSACTGPPRDLDTRPPPTSPSAALLTEPTAPEAALEPAPCARDAPATDPASALAPTLHARRRHAWIRPSPSARSPWIGYLGLGDSVRLRSTTPVRGEGCAAFLPIEPRGYVCLDERVTLDASDPQLVAIRTLGAAREGPWPFDYGEARETPRYWTVPSAAEQRRREWQLDAHLEAVARKRSGAMAEESTPVLLRGIDPTPAGRGPDEALQRAPAVHEYRLNLKAGSTLSWVSQFDAEGRTWLVTPDLALVPKDKVAPFARSSFHGIAFGAQETLPTALVRSGPATRHERAGDGDFRARQASWPRLAHVRLTGRQERAGARRFLETADDGAWIDESEAAVVRAAAWTPWGEAVEGSDGGGVRTVHRPVPPESSRGTWIEVSVHGGWMIAYERTRPVFATLVATGRGESVRRGGREEVESSTTPGVFNLQGKYRTSTMAVTEIVHFDVTFAMPFAGTIAFHTAYWHDRWGEKASMGCVNLSPMDAQWLFEWAEPELPAGWHGVSSSASGGYATIVVVHG